VEQQKRPAAKPNPDSLVTSAMAAKEKIDNDDSTNDGAPLQRNQYTNPKNQCNKKQKALQKESLVLKQQNSKNTAHQAAAMADDSNVKEINTPAAKAAPTKEHHPLLALLMS